MPQYSEKPIIISLSVDILPGSEAAFAAWQAALSATAARASGFISLEFLSPETHQRQWVVVLRFASFTAAETWTQSPQHQALIDELKQFSLSHKINETTSSESNVNEGVTQMIFAEVLPGKLAAFHAWSSKIHAEEAKFPGFRGVYIQSPIHGNATHWITLLRFDSIPHLDNWLDSTERRQLLKEAAPLVRAFESHRIISPYAGWFASIAKVSEVPPVWKQTMLVLLVLFPIVMLEMKYLSPLTKGLDISLATFIGNAISVCLISFPLMPLAIKCLGWWLSPSTSRLGHNALTGTLAVLVLYLVEIAAFWRFL